jgi:D-arabinose 1-dehydrogenase-like Zn-dependent alcohol dehydrogenase
MQAQHVIFLERDQVALQPFEFDMSNLAPDEVAFRTEYSLISPGTELACLAGIEHWAPFPWGPGYAGVGQVLAVGEAITHVRPGDRVFGYTPTPATCAPAAWWRRCRRRRSGAGLLCAYGGGLHHGPARQPGRAGRLCGRHRLGLVGNLAAQLFNLAGCDVIGLDLAAHRRELASRLGARYVIDSGNEDAKARVAEITGGQCAALWWRPSAPGGGGARRDLAGKLGEVILLGSPRRSYTADLNDFLNNIHLWERNCVTFKGAHEWRYPLKRVPGGQVKHSIERNVEIFCG